MVDLKDFSKTQEIDLPDVDRAGEWTTGHFLYLAPLGKIISELKPTDTDICWYYATCHMLDLFGSQDPSPIHFVVARDYLHDRKINDTRAVDLLARELVTKCQRLRDHIFRALSNIAGNTLHLIDNEERWIPARDNQPDFTCSSPDNTSNMLDLLYAQYIHSIGKNGAEAANVIIDTAKERFAAYRESGYESTFRPAAWSLWIKTTPYPSVFSAHLATLAHIVWLDMCNQRWEREKHNVPAITRGALITTLKPPLSKDTKVQVQDGRIDCFSPEGKVVATVPCVDPKLVNLVCKGMQGFSTLTGHKLLRWEVRQGFENWISGADDPRLIVTRGGYEGIANLSGNGSSNQAPLNVKAILHAQAYGHFTFPQGGSGNMIILREIERYRNGEPSQINIILGELLLPNFGNSLPKGDKRRLVPITDLPPLIGSKNTHASQAMLQLLVLEDFANQSDRLAQHGSIFLPNSRWQELAKEAKLPSTYIAKVISGWTEDDLFAKAFLQKQGDEYTLGARYAGVIDFLEHQGKQRLAGAAAGTKSANSKKSLVKRKYQRKQLTKVKAP
jgi:hypothetical protein